MTMSNRRASVPYLPKHDAGLRSANDEDDPYRAAAKPPEPTRCPQCKATFNEGRWSWEKAPADSYENLCPACQRIHDHWRLVIKRQRVAKSTPRYEVQRRRQKRLHADFPRIE